MVTKALRTLVLLFMLALLFATPQQGRAQTVTLTDCTRDGLAAAIADNTALFELDAVTLPEGCMVTTDAIINLREGPGMDDEIIRRIPFDVTLTAFEQSGQWYFVDYLGLRGWMSANYVTPNELC